jgi:hypothetical protein
MKFVVHGLVVFTVALLAGCSSSHQAPVMEAPVASAAVTPMQAPVDTPVVAVEDPVPAITEKTWKPKFIPTGFASGIMVEFTGLKNNATLHAHFASLELNPQSAGVNPGTNASVNSDTPPPIQEASFRLTATINDLRQAFFKVTPGLYHIRQTKDWAEDTLVKNVEVREGSYSVVQLAVKNPKSVKPTDDTGMNANR